MVESLLCRAKMSAIRLWVLVILVLAYAGLDVASDQGPCRQSCGDKPVPCSFGVDSNCGNPPGAVESPSSSSPSAAKNLGPVLGGVAAGGAGVASFILCLLLGYRRLKSWRSRRSHGKEMRNIALILDAGSGSSSDLTRFSYKELATATKHFHPDSRIGGGGFSVVYRGKLKDGRQVAVKKLHQANLQGRQQFMAELTVLSQAKHPNLVQLYGSCPEPRILVYEYVANGTLAEHLHGSRSVPFLNCRTRLSIAVEVAEALAYLHSLHPPIVHRDVKSSNILLDEGCRAKVGDFGLSRLHDVERTHVSTAPQGTPGYLDPDYHQTYHLSDKSDVYSLGVVLMELVSGKKAVDMSRERGEINLSAMAAARIQSGATEELLDPGLASSAGGKDAAMALAELGFQCLATEKDDRPSMQEVVSKIKSIQYMAFAFPSPALSPLRETQESSRLIKFKSGWVPSESYPGLDLELQGR